jgi:hypothetical protein
MASVQLKIQRFNDYDTNVLQTNVQQAVTALSLADQPSVVVAQSNSNLTLNGTEDYVLFDMSGATKDVFVLLPSPGSLTRAVTVKVTEAGKHNLYIKGSDTGSVKINGQNQVRVTDSATVVATPTQFFTV